MKIVRNLTAIASVAAALTIAAQARADTINFYLNQLGCTGNPCVPPSLISDSSAVEVIVATTMGSAGHYTQATVEFVAPGANTINAPVYINVNGTWNTTYSASVVGGANGNVGGVTGPGGFDRFGTMTNGTGGQDIFSTVTFTLTALGNNFWTSADDVLRPTTNYDPAYGHGFEATTQALYAGSYSAVPGPIVGAGLPGLILAALGIFGWRRRQKLA